MLDRGERGAVPDAGTPTKEFEEKKVEKDGEIVGKSEMEGEIGKNGTQIPIFITGGRGGGQKEGDIKKEKDTS